MLVVRRIQTFVLGFALSSCASARPLVAPPTERNAPVPRHGAPVLAVEPVPEAAVLDADADKIPDADDQCIEQPETYNGFMDNDGCPDQIPEGICHCFSPPEIIFPRPTDVRLDRAATFRMKWVAKLLRAHPGPVRLRGHASPDEAATEAERVALGEKRAVAVREHLVRLGLDRSRFVVESLGASELRDCTKDTDFRQRRVQVFFDLPSRTPVVPEAVPVIP